MNQLDHLTAEIDAIPTFTGKRLEEIPGGPRALRYKWRWRFYRIADASFVLLIWNAIAATAASNPVWKFALAFAVFNIAVIFFAESRARICTRQLHRPAAEQLARDLLGYTD